MLTSTEQQQTSKLRRRVRAILLSDRIDTSQIEQQQVVAAAPLTYKFGQGFVTLFRYGVVVTMGLTPEEESDVLRQMQPRLIRPVLPTEEEAVLVEIAADKDDQILPGGPILLKELTPE